MPEGVKMKKFKVYDLYEGKEVLGYASTLAEVKKIARTQYEATDGECAIFYAALNEETHKYKFSSAKFLEVL